MAKKSKKIDIKVENEEKVSESPKFDYKKANRQFLWVVAIMILLVVVIIGVYLFMQNIGKFSYMGLAFDTVKQGNLVFYHYSHYFDYNGKAYQYNLYLRGDPRKNNVPVDANIYLPGGNTIVLSINVTNGLDKCEDTTLAVAGELSPFFINHMFKVQGAVPDQAEAQQKNVTYKTCGNKLSNETVIMIQSANETRIYQSSNGCYIMNIANCEAISAVEKFEVETLIQAKEKTIAELKSSK